MFSLVDHANRKCRVGEPKDGDDSAQWQRSVGGAGDDEDQEAEQAGEFASQIGHEKGVPSHGQSRHQSGTQFCSKFDVPLLINR